MTDYNATPNGVPINYFYIVSIIMPPLTGFGLILNKLFSPLLKILNYRERFQSASSGTSDHCGFFFYLPRTKVRCYKMGRPPRRTVLIVNCKFINLINNLRVFRCKFFILFNPLNQSYLRLSAYWRVPSFSILFIQVYFHPPLSNNYPIHQQYLQKHFHQTVI